MIKTSSKISVTALHSGDLRVRLSGTINLKHPRCIGMKDRELLVPVYAYLVRHERFGCFLIDTGCDASYINNVFGPMRGILLPLVMSVTILKPHEAIDQQLLKHVSSLNEIRAVFFTHLHLDHTSGLPSLPDDVLLVCGEGESSLSIPLLLEPRHFNNKKRVYTLDFNSDYALSSKLGKAIDIFGDSSFWALSTQGHSKGHVSFLVNTISGPVLVAGDASILNLGMERGVGPGTYSMDVDMAQKTMDRLYASKRLFPRLRIWSGHDAPE